MGKAVPNQLGDYLDSLKACLKMDSAVKVSVTHELRTHLEDRSQELEKNGLSEEEASSAAVESFGSPQLVAQQIYEVHSRGTWQEAFLAASPHLLVALLFATYYWQNIFWTSITVIVIACTVIYGWCHNQPVWFFPWLGYYLLPVIVTGALLIYLPQGWTWLVALAYLPLALFTVAYIVKQTASRDWLYVSLMLAPLPVACAWLLDLGTGDEFLKANMHLTRLQPNVPWIVTSLLVLAVAAFTFTRVRQRWCKIAALLIPVSVVFVSVALAGSRAIGFWGWLVLVISLLVVASPAWLQSRA
jgi:hypothetical protein